MAETPFKQLWKRATDPNRKPDPDAYRWLLKSTFENSSGYQELWSDFVDVKRRLRQWQGIAWLALVGGVLLAVLVAIEEWG